MLGPTSLALRALCLFLCSNSLFAEEFDYHFGRTSVSETRTEIHSSFPHDTNNSPVPEINGTPDRPWPRRLINQNFIPVTHVGSYVCLGRYRSQRIQR